MKKIRATHLSLALGVLSVLIGLLASRGELHSEAIAPRAIFAAQKTQGPGDLPARGGLTSRTEDFAASRTSLQSATLPDPNVGRVRVQSKPGGPFLPLKQGQLVLRHAGTKRSIPIVNGAWVLPAEWVATQGARVLEVWSDVDQLSFYPVDFMDAAALPDLHAYSYSGAFLLARDNLGKVLGNLTIYDNLTSGGRMPSSNTVHPGNQRTLDPYPHSGVTPPFLKELPGEPWAYWVHAEGHQWGHVPGSWTRGRDVLELELEQGAALHVRIDGFALKTGLKLTVEREGQALATYVGLREPDVRLQGLPPGNVRVMLSFDEHFGMDPRAIASSETETLYPATTREVRLQMPAMPEASALGTISGTLAIEELTLWSDTDTYAQAKVILEQVLPTPGFAAMRSQDRTHTLRSLETDALPSHFDFRRVPQGDYILSIWPLGIEFPVTVTGGQTSFVSCLVPALARTEVEAWTATGSPKELYVFPTRPASVSSGYELIEPGAGDEVKRFTFISLPGVLNLSGLADGVPIATDTFQVRAGRNERRMEVLPLKGPASSQPEPSHSR